MSRSKRSINVTKEETPTSMYMFTECNGVPCLVVPVCTPAEKSYFSFTFENGYGDGEDKHCSFLTTDFSLFENLLCLVESLKETDKLPTEDVKLAVVPVRKDDIEEIMRTSPHPDGVSGAVASYCISSLLLMVQGGDSSQAGVWEVASAMAFPILSSGEHSGFDTKGKKPVYSSMPPKFKKLLNNSPNIKLYEPKVFLPTDAVESAGDEVFNRWLQYVSFRDILPDDPSGVLVGAYKGDYWSLPDEKEAKKIYAQLCGNPTGDVFRHYIYPFTIKFAFKNIITPDDIYTFLALCSYLRSEYAKSAFQEQADKYFPEKAAVYDAALTLGEIPTAVKTNSLLYGIEGMSFSGNEDLLD